MGAEYNKNTGKLSLVLNGRNEPHFYTYRGVPQGVAQGLFDAKSAGEYFNRNIKGSFPFSKD